MNELRLQQRAADVVFTGVNLRLGKVHTACLWACGLSKSLLLDLAALYGHEWAELDGDGSVTITVTDFRVMAEEVEEVEDVED